MTYGWQNVTYRWQNVTYRWQNETVRVNEPERTVVLTGLEVSTEYEIKVAAATNYQGNYSQAILVKTDDGGEGLKVMLIRLFAPPPHPRGAHENFVRRGFAVRSAPLPIFSKIQLVVRYQCCILIG